jgi:uroporphyrinogen III methyltransferase/synthase
MGETPRLGTVYLVGAGPGDPGLLTVRGAEVLSLCDVVIYDALVNSAVLNYAPAEAERLCVGEAHAAHRLTQEEIIRLMIERARRGLHVVRLKGGDPFIFGRGGEEAMALRAAGIPFEVVPGVSAGHAVAAYAGIPLTHRGISSSVAFVTGHECAGSPRPVRWEDVARAADTVVVFMGASRLPQIVERLLEAGRSPDTPIAVIERGTLASQRTRVATLATIRARVAEEPVRSPALIVVGEVVALREQVAWFEETTVCASAALLGGEGA